MGEFLRAATGATGLVASTTVYVAVGPLSVGGVLRRVRVCWAAAGAVNIAMAFVLSSTDEETLVTLNAGRPLITRSNSRIGLTAAVSFTGAVDNNGVFDVFWGVPLLASERYVLLGMTSSGIGAGASAVFSVEMEPAE